MNRRRILSLLAGLPFVGVLVKPADGVSLTNTTHHFVKGYERHTLTGWDEVGRYKIETIKIDLQAHAGR